MELVLALREPWGKIYFWLWSYLVCSLSLFLSLEYFGNAWAILSLQLFLPLHLPDNWGGF